MSRIQHAIKCVLVVMLLTSCSLPATNTPVDAAKTRNPEEQPYWKAHVTRTYDSRAFVLHTSKTKDGSADKEVWVPTIGVTEVSRYKYEWSPELGIGFIRNPQLPADQTIEYGVFTIEGGVITFGQTLTSTATMAAALFDTGEVVTDTVTNEMFLLFAPAQTVCAVCVLDAQGQTLQVLDPATTTRDFTPPPDARPCPQILP